MIIITRIHAQKNGKGLFGTIIVINLILLEFMEAPIMVKGLFGKRIKVFLFLSIKLNS